MKIEDTIQQLYADVSAPVLSVNRLTLSHFRCYEALSLEVGASPVVLTGPNGAGKTNILEAISFLSPGRGLRNAKLTDIDRNQGGLAQFPWAVSAHMAVDGEEEYHIGTGRDPQSSPIRAKRVVRIDNAGNTSQSELARVCTVMWQTPQMDGLFLAAASERRKFMDRMVYNFDPLHATRVNHYEQAMRERMRLLQDRGDVQWIAIVEERMASEAVAIAAARNEMLSIVTEAIARAPSAFPKAVIRIEGELERQLLQGETALAVEDAFREKLLHNRRSDMHSGRTHTGVHRSDLVVSHDSKHMLAASCSTGEQKALLLSLILAEARAKALWKQSVPILLLDEVVAHLDDTRREALFEEVIAMRAQVWMTGTDEMLFAGLKNKAQFFHVESSMVTAQYQKEIA